MSTNDEVYDALNGMNIKELRGNGHTVWEETLNDESELIKHTTESTHSLLPHLPLLLISFFMEIYPQASWSVFSFANPPTMVHMNFWGVPHASHSVTVSFCLINQSPSLPLPEGLILKLGGDSVSKARTALWVTEWANQYLVTMLFSMLIGINAGTNEERRKTCKDRPARTPGKWLRRLIWDAEKLQQS